MYEDAHLEMAYEDRWVADSDYFDTSHYCEDDYEDGTCSMCGAEL